MSADVVVCLGAGRSGTSMLMKLLSECGLAVSDEMIEPSEQNPEGGYEDKFIFNAHSELLQKNGLNHEIPVVFEELDEATVTNSAKKLGEYVVQKASCEGLWGFKDPRTSSLLPMWKRIFNQKKIVPKYILCVRSPSQVVESLHSQYGYTKSVGEAFWLRKYLDALTYTGGNVFIVHYEDWSSDEANCILSELASFVGLPHLSLEKAKTILKKTVKKELNRSQWAVDKAANKKVIDLYSSLLRVKGGEYDRSLIMPKVQEISDDLEDIGGWLESCRNLLRKKNHNLSMRQQEVKLLKKGKAEFELTLRDELRRNSLLLSKTISDSQVQVQLLKELNAYSARIKQRWSDAAENSRKLNSKLLRLKSDYQHLEEKSSGDAEKLVQQKEQLDYYRSKFFAYKSSKVFRTSVFLKKVLMAPFRLFK